MAFSRERIEFLSKGDIVRGEIFIPDASDDVPRPAILLSHGWGMTAGGNLVDFALAFVEAGFIAVTIDFRNLGLSDGAIRQDINPYEQIEDIRNALSFVSGHPPIDEDRIGLWGSSFSGGHSLVVAALDRRVKCVVAQVPTTDGPRAAKLKLDAAAMAAERARFEADRAAVLQGAAPKALKNVSADPNESVLYPGADSYQYMHSDGLRSPSWRNESTQRSVEYARGYMPAAYVPHISPTPLLMIIATHDVVCPTSLQLEAFATAAEPKLLHQIPGGHYTPYIDQFEDASSQAVAWFTTHLGDPR